MRIKNITINNYRNIDGISVHLHPECSYIIGENNLGKSNFLNLLNTLCSGKSFDDEDFSDQSKPILIELTLRLEPGERGFFGDNFSPDDPSEINIRYLQNITDNCQQARNIGIVHENMIVEAVCFKSIYFTEFRMFYDSVFFDGGSHFIC